MKRRDVILMASTAASALALGSTAEAATQHSARRAASVAHPRLRVRDWGAGKPVVFLSGWALPADFWQYHMIDLTTQGFRCIAYDRRGHGHSDDPGAGYDFDTLADDLARTVEALDLTDITLVAYSMGGGEAARYLTRYGSKRVARVAFVSATLPFLLKTADNPEGVPARAFAEIRGTLAKDFPKWVSDSNDAFWLNKVSPEMQAWGRDLMLQASLPALIALNKAITDTDFRADLRAIDRPSLVIHGDKDASAPLPLTGARTAKLIPGAQFTLYEGAPHGLPLTYRDQFTRDLATFINRGSVA